MNRLPRINTKAERAQSLVITLVFMFALLGMAALVLDVGSWYRADRKLQANADAAALAGARELPDNPGAARLQAVDYGDRNDGGVAAKDVTFPSGGVVPNDTIKVQAERPAPGFFAKIFGLDSVQVRATAIARTGVLSRARWAAPIGIDYRHPMLQCECWGDPTTLDFDKVGPGAFRLLNIDSSYGGTSPSDLEDWIRKGLDAWMDKDRWYYSDPGIKPNSSHISNALDFRDETELLFPVYNAVRAQGAGFEYYVIGWAVFHVTAYEIQGSKNSRLYGWFVDMIWEGVGSESAGDPDFGARTVTLIE